MDALVNRRFGKRAAQAEYLQRIINTHGRVVFLPFNNRTAFEELRVFFPENVMVFANGQLTIRAKLWS